MKTLPIFTVAALAGISLLASTQSAKAIPMSFGGIHGFVYEDENDNGMHDPSAESGVELIRLELFDSQGELIREESTDVNGQFWFTDLPTAQSPDISTYYVEVNLSGTTWQTDQTSARRQFSLAQNSHIVWQDGAAMFGPGTPTDAFETNLGDGLKWGIGRGASVPEGGTTLAMLGLALAGIVRFRRSMV